jgi:hypothetical protein
MATPRTHTATTPPARHSRPGPRKSPGSTASRGTRRCRTSAAGPRASPSRCSRSCRQGRVLAVDASREMVTLAHAQPGGRRCGARTCWTSNCRTGRRDRLGGGAALGDRPRPPVEAAGPGAAARRNPGSPVQWGRQHRSCLRGHRDGRPGRVPGAGRRAAIGFASPEQTKRRPGEAGFSSIRCWLQDRRTYPRTSPRWSAPRSRQPISPGCPWAVREPRARGDAR